MKIKHKYITEEDSFIQEEESFLQDLVKIKTLISYRQINIHFKIPPEEIIKNKEYFLVSSVWCEKALGFLDEATFNFSSCNINDMFEIKKFFKKFSIFNYSPKKQDDIYHVHPGPVNNFDLIKFKDFWFDNHKNYSYSNIFLSKKIVINFHYLTFNKYEWDLIKETFGCLYEIKRLRVDRNTNIEIFPKEVNYILLEKKFYFLIKKFNKNLDKNFITK